MTTSNGIPGYISAYEAAELIGVSYSQVTRYITHNKLDAVVIGREYLIRETDAKKFVRPKRGNPYFVQKTAGKQRP